MSWRTWFFNMNLLTGVTASAVACSSLRSNMSSPTLFEIYDYTNDRLLGVYQDYEVAQSICDEYLSSYGEPVEAIVQPLDN